MDNGFIKLHRKLLNNPIIMNAELLQLFVYCLLRANYTDTNVIWNGKNRLVKRGSFITGIHVLCEALNQKQSSLYRRLTVLHELGYIRVKAENKFSEITILKYNTYQSIIDELGKQTENKRKTNGKQTDTDKNNKNNKKDKKITPAKAVSKILYRSLMEVFIIFYNQHKTPNKFYWSAKDAGQIKNIVNRIRSTTSSQLTDEQIITAFKRLLWSIPDSGWLWDNLSPAIIVSKWNEINAFINEKDRAGIVKTETERAKEFKIETQHSGKGENLKDVLGELVKP